MFSSWITIEVVDFVTLAEILFFLNLRRELKGNLLDDFTRLYGAEIPGLSQNTTADCWIYQKCVCTI